MKLRWPNPSKRFTVVSCIILAVGVLGYIFRWYLLTALFFISPDLATSMMFEIYKYRSEKADTLVAEATALPPKEAVAELSQLIREHPFENGAVEGGFDWLVRRRALKAIGQYPAKEQAAALPEIMNIFANEYGDMSFMAFEVLKGMEAEAHPAAPKLVELLNSGTPFWRRMNAAVILGNIPLDPEVRRQVLSLLSGYLLSADTTFPENEIYLSAVIRIDQESQISVPLLKRLSQDDSSEVQDQAWGHLMQIGVHDEDVRQWLEDTKQVEP